MRILAIIALSVLWIVSAQAQTIPTCPLSAGQTGTCGVSIAQGATVTVLASTASGGNGRTYSRVLNSGTAAQGTAWCVWGAYTPGVNGAGSYAIGPRGNTAGNPSSEEFGVGTGNVPQPQLTCTSDGGTSGTAPAIMTVLIR